MDTIVIAILFLYVFFIIFFTIILFFSKRKLNKDYNNNIKTYYLKSLNFLNIIYMTSPFLGLIGTVDRILTIFKDKSLFTKDDSFAIIVYNLGMALEVTMYGISTALIGLVFYLYYKNELKIIWMKNELI
jgi:biopolymer transport protein ExbB/TolQ